MNNSSFFSTDLGEIQGSSTFRERDIITNATCLMFVDKIKVLPHVGCTSTSFSDMAPPSISFPSTPFSKQAEMNVFLSIASLIDQEYTCFAFVPGHFKVSC